ncbi:MAG: DEAD/DEAH box helicase [Cyclobacteriaceae bacterium]
MALTFQETGLKPEILSAVTELGFVNPTPIQEKSIPFLLSEQQDLIAFAQTGTGKTAAFGLPLLNEIDPNSNSIQALILCPTRELCVQIYKDFESYSKNMKGLRVTSVYGGESMEKQIKALKRGVQVVVGTPGRVKDLINRRILKVEKIEWLVLDEADEMLSMGFKEDLDTILGGTPEDKRSLLFSATMPKELIRISNQYMNDPFEINLGTKNKSSENVEHHYYCVKNRDRYQALKRVLDVAESPYAIVFCRTRYETKDVADLLIQDGYKADALHGDLSQGQREQVLGKFRKKGIEFLVATDVAARGLDINNLTHVINYNLPDNTETYIHRSGRTGRANNFGISISIISDRDVRRIRDIERTIGKTVTLKKVPGANEIAETKIQSFTDRILNQESNEKLIGKYLPLIEEKLADLSKEKLVEKIASMELSKIFNNQSSGVHDINLDPKDKNASRRASNENFSRLFINIGKDHGLNPQRLMGLINDYAPQRNTEIGKIDIMRDFSFFEIEKTIDRDLIESMDGQDFEGRRIGVEVSKEKPRGGSGRDRGRSGGGGRGGYGGGGNRRGGGYSGGRDRDRNSGGGGGRRRR